MALLLGGALYAMLSYESVRGMVVTTDAKRVWFLSVAPALTGLMSAAIIACCERDPRFRLAHPHAWARVGWKAVTALGVWTYALYVLHEPILLGLRKLVPQELSLGQSVAFLVPGSIAVLGAGWFTYRFIEQRFDRLKR